MKRRASNIDTELNLSSMIDIMSIMLFFLMTTVTFMTLKTLNTSVPASSSGAVSTTDGVNVSVEVLADKLVMKASGQPEDKSVARLDKTLEIPLKADASYDYEMLTAELWKVKEVAPEAKNIMIFPADGIVFQHIVSTMDAVREKKSTLDPNKVVPMFTRPVLSELEK